MEEKNFENLYNIFSGYPDKLKIVQNWEKDYRKAALINNLYEHAAVQQLVSLLTGFIKGNEATLLTQKRADYPSDELYFDERTRLEAENNAWKLIINFFTKAQSTAASIAEKVTETNNVNSK